MTGGGISVHAVDVASGRPAAGLRVKLFRYEDSERRLVAEGDCTATGVLDHPVAGGADAVAGVYEAEFSIGDFYRMADAPGPSPPFVDVAVYRFGIADAAQHYHLPLKFTAWGFSLFRGGL
jgi:5-hydroxyisourate hydrolase